MNKHRYYDTLRKGKIEFHNVSFHHENGENVLSQVNLLIHPGEKIGILGTTSPGKSILVHLIPRFFDPTEGKKWDTEVGERGIGLSREQRQRIAIARAVLHKPDIIILDAVTLSVDADTEQKLIHNLFQEFKERTVIIISLKIITVQNTDRIIIMDKGEIMGTGSHKDLLFTQINQQAVSILQKLLLPGLYIYPQFLGNV